MKEEAAGIEKETPAERRKKAREQYAPFVNESVNILLDMATLGAVTP
jgi:carboxyl-terminal processing protease